MSSFRIDSNMLRCLDGRFSEIGTNLHEDITELRSQISNLEEESVEAVLNLLYREVSLLNAALDESETLRRKNQEIASCYEEEENQIIEHIHQLPTGTRNMWMRAEKSEPVWCSEYLIFDPPIWDWIQMESICIDYSLTPALLLNNSTLLQEDWLYELLLEDYQED